MMNNNKRASVTTRLFIVTTVFGVLPCTWALLQNVKLNTCVFVVCSPGVRSVASDRQVFREFPWFPGMVVGSDTERTDCRLHRGHQ